METCRAVVGPRGLRSRVRFGAIAVAAVVLTMGVLAPGGAASAASPPAQGWTTTEAPLPADAGTGATDPAVYTASSTCPGENGCLTVGWYNDTGGKTWGLIETQSGTSWTETQAPQPANAGSGADQGLWLGSPSCGIAQPCQAVSCPTTATCVAVGQYEDNLAHRDALLETDQNGTWTAQAAPLPADAGTGGPSSLLSVTCTSVTSCVAVGQYQNGAGHDVGLIDTLDGTTWSAQAAPAAPDANPASPTQFLGHVACSSSTSCAAVGFYDSTSAGTAGLVVTLSGATWTAMRAPLPADATAGAFSELYRVACPSPGSCVAVGQYGDAAGFPAVIETMSGGTWTATKAPVPGDAGTGAAENSSLTGLSCGSPTSCVAVGAYHDTNSRFWGLIETDTAGAWTATQAAQPSDAATGAGQDGTLDTVDCPNPGFCMADGFYASTQSAATGYIQTLRGGSWSVIKAPVPANDNAAASVASIAKTVACSSPASCTVGGFYTDTSGHTQGFLDTYTGVQGYWLGASDGGVFTYGNAQFEGSAGSLRLNQPVVGMAATADGQGYWMVASDGGIFDYGDAGFFGSRGGQPLNKPIVGMAATPDGLGYWLVASDGGIFGYGDATFYGSRGGQPLNKPIVGMAATPDGKGYWLVASDGGIFSYGDAQFYGSTGSLVLNKPVVGMASSPDGLGYWLVASDGGIFSYGDAQFYGSTGSLVLNKPVVGMAASPSGLGYWLVASDGGIFNYGDGPFYGSAGSLVLNKPVVAMAA